jgi:predicted aldo/keto reductase-like oxidoreductase
MRYTGYQYEEKPLASLSLGCMRFPTREATVEVIAACREQDVRYLDTSPGYCYQSDADNSETWVGAAIQGQREQFILSAKCSTSNGGDSVGEYDPAHGFSITTADQVRRQIEQSLRRLQVDTLDFYQLWSIHAPATFDEALKPGGWLEGVLKAKDEGLFRHLGITGHADAAEITRWIDTGCFEMITVPFHIMDTSRLEGIRYAREKGVAVIAMNPLVGGLLGSPSTALAAELADLGVTSATDMALRFVASFPGVSALSGMRSPQEVHANAEAVSALAWTEEACREAQHRFEALLGKADHVCTACGYCMPCPQDLNIPEILKLRNYYLLLQLDSAARTFVERYKWWGNSFKADRCLACGACESRCPNGLPISTLMGDVMERLGDRLARVKDTP